MRVAEQPLTSVFMPCGILPSMDRDLDVTSTRRLVDWHGMVPRPKDLVLQTQLFGVDANFAFIKRSDESIRFDDTTGLGQMGGVQAELKDGEAEGRWIRWRDVPYMVLHPGSCLSPLMASQGRRSWMH